DSPLAPSRRSSSASTARNVSAMLSPVSPSATGNTLRSLTSSRRDSRCASAPATAARKRTRLVSLTALCLIRSRRRPAPWRRHPVLSSPVLRSYPRRAPEAIQKYRPLRSGLRHASQTSATAQVQRDPDQSAVGPTGAPTPRAALVTLPAFRQRVHTYTRRGALPTRILTFCKFGSNRRLVATIE